MKNNVKKLEILESRKETIVELISDTNKLEDDEKSALIEVFDILMKLVYKLQ